MPVCLWEREGAAGPALHSARTGHPGGVCWEQRCPHRALGLQVPLFLRNTEQSTVISCTTSQMAFAGFQEKICGLILQCVSSPIQLLLTQPEVALAGLH